MTLLVAPCDIKAARHAVMHWHYSQRMPIGKIVRHGVWEDDQFIGAVLYARGASPALGDRFGLTQLGVCELVRVALTDHVAPVSQIVAASQRLLKVSNPGLRLIVSFADPAHGHVGGIYQAMGWVYTGTSAPAKQYWFKGRWVHNRTVSGPPGFDKGGTTTARRATPEQIAAMPIRVTPGKHRYLMPLDKAMRRRVLPLALPYPRGSSLDGETLPQPGK